MADVVFTGNANFEQVNKAFEQLVRENVKLSEKLQHYTSETRKASQEEKRFRQMQIAQARAVEAEQKKLAAEAQRTIDATRTPFERYKIEAGKLREQLQAGRIDTETYRRALTDLAKQTKAAATDTEALRQAEARENAEKREAAQVLQQIETRTERYETALAKLNRLKKNGRITQEQYNRALQQEERQLKQNETQSTGNLKKLAATAAAYFGIQEAIAAVIAEMEKKAALEKKDAQVERTLEQSLADIALNVGGENVGQAREMIETNAPKLGVDQAGLAQLLGDAISAGADDLEEAMEVVSASLSVTAGDSQKANELVQTSLDLTKFADSDNFRGALGQVSQTQSQVRATDASQFFTNLGPALAAATADKDNTDKLSTERALELSAVVSQVLSDRQGANTGTTLRQFVTRLDSFEAKETDTLSKDDIAKFQSTRSVDERIEMFRANKELRDQFLDEQEEGTGKQAIREIVGGSDRVLQFEQKAGAAISSIDQAAESFAGLEQGVLDNTTLLRAQRKAESARETAATTGDRAISGQARQIVEDTLADVNLPGVDQYRQYYELRQFDANAEMGQDPIDNAIDTLNSARGSMLTGELAVSESDNKRISDAINILADLQRETLEIQKRQLEQSKQKEHAGLAASRRLNQGEG